MKHFEHPESLEPSEAKKRLLDLEATGTFLFHGSPYKIEELEPRQAHTRASNESYEMVPDGEPSVAASPYAEIAIFRAIVNRENIPESHTGSFGSKTDEEGTTVELSYGFTPNVPALLPNSTGYVYVLKKSQFNPRAGELGMEWRSERRVKPVEIIEVHEQDLPSKIELLNDIEPNIPPV